MATTIPNAGTYELLIDTGYPVSAFVLDDPLRGVLDSPDWVLDGIAQSASVIDGTTNLSVFRGRIDADNQFTAGTMTFTLNDTLADGVFNPFDNDSPYFDPQNDKPGLAPGRKVEFIRYDDLNNPEMLFTGRIVNYEYEFRLGGLDTVTVFCADNLYRLASTSMSAQNPTKQMTGARINAVLDLPEVDYPTGTARNIAAGTVELGGGSQYEIAEGTNVLEYFNQITTTAEFGRIFVDRSGTLISQDRVGGTTGSPVATFSDNGTGLAYNDLGIDFKADEIINLVEVSIKNGGTATASDVDSQTEYFIKSLYIPESLLHDLGSAEDLANYLLNGQPEARFTSVQTWLGSLNNADKDIVAIIDIGDRIDIEKHILVGGTPTLRAQQLFVEGIEHRLNFDMGHTIRVFTSPVTVTYDLILDDGQYGQLSRNNVLG